MNEEDFPLPGGSLPTPSERVWTEFLAFLDELPPGARAAFLLHDVFGLPYTEIAYALGASPEECRSQVEQARRHAHARHGADRGRSP